MVKGISRSPSYIASYNRNAASVQTDNFSFQNRLIDRAVNSNNSLKGKQVTIYMDCLVSQVSGNGQELHMKYDESSTEENPVIYAWGTDLSGEAFETKIFVNDIDPYQASPAEMKALYAYLAEKNGGAKSNSISIDAAMNGYDVNQKINFVQYLEEWNAMQELAKNPAADSERLQLEQYLAYQQQYQNVRNTVLPYQDSLTKNQRAFYGLDIMGLFSPDEVKDAWAKAEEETGVNGYGMNAEGKLTHITMLFAMSLEKMLSGGGQDILGSTADSAKAAVQKALERLGIPQNDKERKEMLFYEAFLRFLK